jgi:hypothetical protein
VDMAGTYSKRTDLLEDFADLRERIERTGPRRSRPPRPRTTGGPKKRLTPEETVEIIAKYEAGASMAQCPLANCSRRSRELDTEGR